MLSAKTVNNTIYAVENGEVVGKIVFDINGNTMTILHTYAYIGGKGVGTYLVEAAVRHAKENDLVVHSVCSFATEYLRRNVTS